MEIRVLASFMDELHKIAESVGPKSNVANPTKPAVGGMGSNAVSKPLPSPGFSAGGSNPTPKPAKPTNYTMVHSNAPMAAFDAGAPAKSVPPPLVRT